VLSTARPTDHEVDDQQHSEVSNASPDRTEMAAQQTSDADQLQASPVATELERRIEGLKEEVASLQVFKRSRL